MAYNPNRVTIYQVAREAKVSLATVSRVMNNADIVSEEKVIAVKKAIEKLGYVPSVVARGLARSTTTNIAVVIPSSTYSYISSILNGIVDVCKQNGYMPMLFTYEDRDEAKQVMESVLSSQAEGVILFNADLTLLDLQRIFKIQLPLVLIGRDSLGMNGKVYTNYEEKLKETIKRFIARGLKEINLIEDDKKQWYLVKGFDEAIKSSITPETKYNIINQTSAYNNLYKYFTEKFKNEKPHHELYVVDRDSVAPAIFNAAIDLGYKVPDDLEVLGVIGTKRSITTRPTISSFMTELYSIGKTSMEMLIKMFDNSTKSIVAEINAEYVKRDSTLD